MTPDLSQSAWQLIFMFSVASILAWSAPRLMVALYNLLREYID